MTLPKRKLLPLEAAQALDTLHGVVRREQDKNNAATLEAIEQTRSITGVRPLNREPRVAAPDGSYSADPAAIYRVVRGSGIVDVAWDGNAVTAETPAAVTINQLGRVAVDAAYHGVEDGADVKTLFAAWDATRNSATLIVPPRITLYHTDPTVPLVFRDKKHVIVKGSGLTIEATAAMGNGRLSGGLTLALIEDCEFDGIKYDGRLDLRMPVYRPGQPEGQIEFTDGSDIAPMNGCAWNIAQYTKRLVMTNCAGVRGMIDGMVIGGMPAEFPGLPSIMGPNMGHTRPTDIHIQHWVSSHNLRQGISGCGYNRVTIEDAKYLYTGKVPNAAPGFRYDTKIALPGAGIDMEAYFDEGGYHNEGLRMRRIEVAHNWGNGLMSEAATYGAEYEDFWIHDNGGAGLLESGAGTSRNTYRRFKMENNLAGPDHQPGGKWFGGEEAYEVSSAHPDFKLIDAEIRTRRGATAIKSFGPRAVLENVTAYAAADATPNEQNGNIRIQGDDPTLRNVKTVGAQATPSWSAPDRAGIFVEKAPLQIVDCRAEITGDTNATRGIRSPVRGKLARGNTASGYAVPVDINSPGEVITLGEATLKLNRLGGPALWPTITLGDQPAEVLVSGPDRLLVRLRQTLGWDRSADGVTFGVMEVTGLQYGLGYKIVNVQAATNYEREPAPAVIPSKSWEAYFPIPAGSGGYGVDAIVDIEIYRK